MARRKVLFVSRAGDGLDQALQLVREGADVKATIRDESCASLYDGMIDKVKDWSRFIPWCDYVLFDYNGMAAEKKLISAYGKPAFGMGHSKKEFNIGGVKFHGYDHTEALEDNRSLVAEIFKSHGIGAEKESLEFKDVKEAIAHLKEHDVPHVVKVDIADDKATTFVGKRPDNEDMIGRLEGLHSRPGGAKVKSIVLEEKIDGVEVGVSAWCNGKKFIGPANVNFEHKKIAAGDLGFNTPEMGTVMYYEKDLSGRLFQETVAKLLPVLVKFDYRGQIDINCIINKSGIYVTEPTEREGYPALYIESELKITPWMELCHAVATGADIENEVSKDWAIGVCLVGEGFPFWKEGQKRMAGVPILGKDDKFIPTELFHHLHFYDAKLEGGQFLATGSYPLTATAKAPTLKEAQRAVYEDVIPQVDFDSMYYRHDIGDRVFEALQKLNAWGYDVRNN